jgi:hypothetical protein
MIALSVVTFLYTVLPTADAIFVLYHDPVQKGRQPLPVTWLADGTRAARIERLVRSRGLDEKSAANVVQESLAAAHASATRLPEDDGAARKSE